jgi:hypothetical protein
MKMNKTCVRGIQHVLRGWYFCGANEEFSNIADGAHPIGSAFFSVSCAVESDAHAWPILLYMRQVLQHTANNKVTSSQKLLSSTMAFGRWISMTKNVLTNNLVSSLFSLYSTWFIQPVSVRLLVVPCQNCNCDGQRGHGGVIFTKFKKEATRQQSTKIKLHRLSAIILILRLVPRDCWLVVVLGKNERCDCGLDSWWFWFCFCCSTCDARARKRFLIDLRAIFWQKGAPTLDLENNWEIIFYMTT